MNSVKPQEPMSLGGTTSMGHPKCPILIGNSAMATGPSRGGNIGRLARHNRDLQGGSRSVASLSEKPSRLVLIAEEWPAQIVHVCRLHEPF
jgi:hypothetical protein